MDPLVETLRAIVGAKYVITRPSELVVYENDGLPGYHKRPRLIVSPGSRDEAIAVVRALAAADAPFVARGAGTGLSGGALADGIVMVGLQRRQVKPHTNGECFLVLDSGAQVKVSRSYRDVVARFVH